MIVRVSPPFALFVTGRIFRWNMIRSVARFDNGQTAERGLDATSRMIGVTKRINPLDGLA
jgi:hypothetical protein